MIVNIRPVKVDMAQAVKAEMCKWLYFDNTSVRGVCVALIGWE